MLKTAFVACALLAFTLLGFFLFPGHTYLQSDTQIYIPMLEHLWDPGTLAHDPVATRPHLSFTIYDEVAIGLRRLTGAGFQPILVAQQVVFRFCGLLGVFLIATACGLSRRMALPVTALFALGATIVGPAVLTIEYEPVPRGFAVPLVFLAIGLAAYGKDFLAGCAASLAFLYHAPTAAPFWGIYFLLTLWPSKPEAMQRRIRGLIPLAAAVILMLALSRLQPGVTERQEFLGRITPEHEALQRMRASYNWVSIWFGQVAGMYAFFFAVAAAAYWRIRKTAQPDLKWFWIGLLVIGALSVPLSYVFLEGLKWTILPQIQPGRGLLFVIALVVIGGGIASAKTGNFWKSALWLIPAAAIPIEPRVFELFLKPDPRKLAALAIIVLLMAVALAAEAARKRWSGALLTAAVLVPFWIIPDFAGTVNYPQLHSPELDQLSAWARSSTAKDAMFLFPDAGREIYPGVFRAKALRAVYTDWKAGGQVNYHRSFADEWWDRWRTTMLPGFDPSRLERYALAGVDYIVVKPAHKLADRSPAFENSRFAVYRLPVVGPASTPAAGLQPPKF